jgi:hypothetical protein
MSMSTTLLHTKKALAIGFLALGLLLPAQVWATLLGAELGYTLGKDSIRVTLITFDDFASQLSINKTVVLSAKNSTTELSLTLSQVAQKDVTPVCSWVCTNYESPYCRYSKTLVKTIYSANVSLASLATTDCEITITWSSCCRPGGEQDYFLSAMFNRCIDATNDNPRLANDPYHYTNVNEPYSYSWMAHDADNDSLVYELVPARLSQSSNLEYDKGLSYEYPFYFEGYPNNTDAFPKGFHLSNQNGLLRFQPTKTGKSPVAVRITEYRKGLKIGEKTREVYMTVDYMSKSKPLVSGINGGSRESVTACLGQKICFSIDTDDKDANDAVDLTWTTDIPGATIQKNSNKQPSLQFCWTPSKNDIRDRTYHVSIRATDNNCVYKGIYERIIEIKVISPFDVSFASTITGCGIAQLTGETNAKNENKLKFEWRVNGNTYFGNSQEVNLGESGTYDAKLIVTNDITGCYNDYKGSIVIPAKPVVEIDGAQLACPGTQVGLNARGALTYTWKDSLGNVLGNKARLDLETTANSTFFLTGTDKFGCAATSKHSLRIHEIDLSISPIESIVCKGTEFEVSATGSELFTWSPMGLKEADDLSARYVLLKNETISATGTDKNGCIGTVDFTMAIDQDCVWPGDVNGDLDVNNRDVLYLGMAYDDRFASGQSPLPSPVWAPYRSTDWPKSFANNRNYKHADADRSGRVDYLDLFVIDQFYTRQITYTNKSSNNNGTKLYFEYNIDSLKGKKNIELDVYLGTSTEPAKDVYGIAFSVDYNKSVDTSTIDFNTDDSWLTEGSGMLKLVKNIPSTGKQGGGKIDIAFTRTNKTSVSGNGKVGSVKFVVDDNLDWKKVMYIELSLDNIEMIDHEGNIIEAYGTGASIPLSTILLGIDPLPANPGYHLYPNPVAGGACLNLSIDEKIGDVTVSLLDLTGKTMTPAKGLSAGLHSFETTHAPGYYLVKLESSAGTHFLPFIVE